MSCETCKGKCCKWLAFPHQDNQELIELSVTRGGRVVGTLVFMPSTCPFITENGRCSIYEKRPKLCRDFEVDGELCRIIQTFVYEVKQL